MKNKIVVATRPSQLAYTQTMQTVALLEKAHPHLTFEVRKFSTKGDRDTRRSLTEFGGTGLFVKELEYALLDGEADIAIHSLKDVPSLQPEGLQLVAFPKREDPRDVLVHRGQDIKTIGTGSPRRLLQMALRMPEVSFTDIRGNIESRLEKVYRGDYDATLLAVAGLSRLGLVPENTTYLSVEEFIPAIGQGALVLECRSDDEETIKIAKSINHEETAIAVVAERIFMKEVEGGCKFPLASHAFLTDLGLHFSAIIGNLETKKYIRKDKIYNLATANEDVRQLAVQMLRECEQEGITLNF